MIAWIPPEQGALFVLLLFVGVGIWYVLRSGPKAEADPAAKLLRERLSALEAIQAHVGKEYRQGRADFAALQGATVTVLQAKLELAKTAEEQVPLHKGLVEQARLRYEFLQEQQDTAATGIDALRSKVTLLEARIAWVRAQQKLDEVSRMAHPPRRGPGA